MALSVAMNGRDMPENWPFDAPPNVAVITTHRIMREGYPILCVVHDDEGDWQFLDSLDVTVDDGSVVGLGSVVNQDRTILELADLPFGCYAERTNVNTAWVRGKMPPVNKLE